MALQTLIGLKRLALSKTRLAAHLSSAERSALMTAMLRHVVAVARDADLGAVALATSEPAAPEMAAMLGVRVFADSGLPWNEGLVHALNQVVPAPDAVLFLGGDLPLLTVVDLRAFASAAPARGVGVARARDGGTNALLLRPATCMTPMFGRRGSAAVHAAEAERLGLACRLVDIPSLALDVDTIEDARDSGVLSWAVSGRDRATPAG